jgi:hypothetical protein
MNRVARRCSWRAPRSPHRRWVEHVIVWIASGTCVALLSSTRLAARFDYTRALRPGGTVSELWHANIGSWPLAAHPPASLEMGAPTQLASTAARAQLRPDDDAVRRAPAALLTRLRDDPYVYFRFINVQWMQFMCERFGDVLRDVPDARLHGDAHLEQYAFTDESRGLDDFDDSAMGPIVLDITRFLASVDLALRNRGWTEFHKRAVDAFFEGYRWALRDPSYLPPDPAVICRLRAIPARDERVFLAWADSLMLPLDPALERALPVAYSALEEYRRRFRPDAPPDYFRMKKVGRLNLGVGSALSTKVLFRFEGPTHSEDDDVIVEAKRASDLSGISCLRAPPMTGAMRVVTGVEQMGRLRHEILMVIPAPREAAVSRWWLRNWDNAYREVDIADYADGSELVEVARDVGAQLGHGNLREAKEGSNPAALPMEQRALDRLEARARQAAADGTAELLDAWKAFRAE